MEKEKAIEYLEDFKEGSFLTLNIPIVGSEVAKVTAMYVGKDKDGRYNLIDNGIIKLTRDFLEKGIITIDKEYDKNVATEIYEKQKLEKEIKAKQRHKEKNREL